AWRAASDADNAPAPGGVAGAAAGTATAAGAEQRRQALQRLLHTFKGSARMAGAMALGEITHYMETRAESVPAGREAQRGLFDELDTAWDRAGGLYTALRATVGAAGGVPAGEIATQAGRAAAGSAKRAQELASEAAPESAVARPVLVR